MSEDLIAICAWCWRGTPPTLTVLDGTPPEVALLALEAGEGLTHGACQPHLAAMRALIPDRKATAV